MTGSALADSVLAPSALAEPTPALLALAVTLFVVAAVFAAAEAALSRLSRATAAGLASSGRRGARHLVAAAEDPAPFLNVSTLLRVGAEAGGAVCVTIVCAGSFHVWWQVLAVAALVTGVISFVVVGVSPRTLGRQHAETVAAATVPVLAALARVLGPLTRVLVVLGNAVTPGRGYRDGPFASEAELRELVDRAQESQLIEAGEHRMIHSVFELGDTVVREVMVPRTDMVTVDHEATLHQAMSLFLRSGFSRAPVTGEGPDDVRGVLYLKDVARRLHEDPSSGEMAVEPVARTARFVPESKSAGDLLRDMQRQVTHVAVVVDEYGGVAGMVTIEDLIEEIVGEISDEYDQQAPGVEDLGDGTLRVSSRLHVDEMGELFGLELDDEDVDTVGGLLAKALGKVPIPGAAVEVSGLHLTAERREGRRNRIATVLVRRVDPVDPVQPVDPAVGRSSAVDSGRRD